MFNVVSKNMKANGFYIQDIIVQIISIERNHTFAIYINIFYYITNEFENITRIKVELI